MKVRLEREKRVVDKMIGMYCFAIHNEPDLCKSCQELKDYTYKRLLNCPFAEDKPVCSKCKIHCYNKKQKEKIKEIMKYSGPKMFLKYPKDTVLYFYDKLKNKNHTVQ